MIGNLISASNKEEAGGGGIERGMAAAANYCDPPGLIARRQKHGLIHTGVTVFPSTHVLDGFRFDLPLEDRVLPSDQQSRHIELGQLQKIALGRKRSAGQKNKHTGPPKYGIPNSGRL